MPLTPAEIQERTSLPFWYPKINEYLPTPETRWVQTDIDLFMLLDGEEPDGFDVFVKMLDEAVAMVGGYPFFLRTGLTSGKHDWHNTCFVPNAEVLPGHVVRLMESSAMADLFGLPSDVWVVRELLQTKPAFHAFWGRMPITKERRYFIRDNRVLGWQPYWPPNSIEKPDVPDWEDKLDRIQSADDEEKSELRALSLKVSSLMEGCWSVDWLWTETRGWVLTDMAVGEASFVWEAWPTAPDPEELIES